MFTLFLGDVGRFVSYVFFFGGGAGFGCSALRLFDLIVD